MEPKKRERDSQNPKSARLVIRLTPEQLAALTAEAERRGISVAELARQAVSVIAPIDG